MEKNTIEPKQEKEEKNPHTPEKKDILGKPG